MPNALSYKKADAVDWFWLNAAVEVIDLRSFSNLWFWIALAVMWSTAAHWVIGVPYDMVNRARIGQPEALADVQTLARIYARRILYIADVSGTIIMVLVFFILTTLGVLGWVYHIEFGQAVFLLATPMAVITGLSVLTARKVDALTPEQLVHTLKMHRIKVQMVGVVSIFCTSMWGMWTNMNVNVLGG